MGSDKSHEENKAENICCRVIGAVRSGWLGDLLEELTCELTLEKKKEAAMGKLKGMHSRQKE